MRTINRLYFISAFKGSRSAAENLDMHNALKTDLKAKDVPYGEAIGTYNSVPELTLIVSGDNNYEAMILDLAKKYRQEAIMIVYSDSAAELVYLETGLRGVIGKFQEVQEGDLRGKDYTFFNEKYWSVR